MPLVLYKKIKLFFFCVLILDMKKKKASSQSNFKDLPHLANQTKINEKKKQDENSWCYL